MTASLVVKRTTVITQDAQRRVLRDVDVVVQNGVIVEVGKARAEADHKINGKDKVLLPGLVNAHTHLPMTLFRGYGDDLPLEEWLQNRIWPAEERLTEKEMRVGTRLALLEMVASGTTSLLDMYFMEGAIAEECKKAGVRAFLSEGMVDNATPPGQAHKKLRDVYPRFIKEWKSKDGLVQPALGPHASFTVNPETLRASADLAKKHDLLLTTHCAETRKEVYDVEAKRGKRPVAFFEENGCLGPNVVLAHCGWITKEEVRTFAKTGTKIAHCPVSNMKLATGGQCPLPELFQEGATVGLGTDGAASNNTLDMVETMKFTALLHKHLRWEPTVLGAQKVLDLATLGGAASLRIEKKVGSVEVGKEADLVLIDLRKPHLVPRFDLVSHMVYAARGSDVSTTTVRGKPLYLEGEFQTLKADRILDDAQEAAERLTSAPAPVRAPSPKRGPRRR